MSLVIPPHSIPAEQSVLGALMVAPERLADIADWLTAGDFYRRDHALIFQSITEQAAKGQPVDPVTLAEWFEGVELSSHVGGLSYLVDLAQTTPSAAPESSGWPARWRPHERPRHPPAQHPR